MNARRRLKLSALSFSLPDVSEVGYTPSPSYYPPAQEILEEPEEAEGREVDEESGPGSYGVGDTVKEKEEVWMDATDPVSGSVFFVNSASLPRPHHNGSAIIPSTSSSSLSSSTTSLSHPHPLSSLTSSPRPHRSSSFTTSLPPTPNDAFFSSSFAAPPSLPPLPHHRPVTPSSSALPSPTNSQNIDEFFASESYFRESVDGDSAHCPSPCPSEGWMPKSVSSSSVGGGSVRWRMRRKWKKMVGRGDKTRGRSYSHGLMPSDSVPNLSCDVEYPRHPPSSVPPSPPHGELFGSQDLPLEGGAHGTIVTARVSLKPHPLAGRPHRHWNLEKLGIIPARALGGKRYRSFTNLRFAFKNHHHPGSSSSSSSLSNSLVIRGIIPGTPASLAPHLQPGDTILAINGHAVFLEMANSIVRAQSGEDELVFIVKKRTHVGSALTSTPAHHHLLTSSRHGNLVRLVSGKETTSSRHHRHSPPLLFLCLTLDTKEEDPADKDILYCYPTEARDWGTASGEGVKSEEVTALLMKLRGVFLTLSDVMSSITADAHSCSTVEVRGRLFHCAHVQRGKEVLLLALPASLLPRHLLLATTIRLEHTLRLLFHSPQSVFPPEDHSNVNHVLSLLFHHLSSQSPYPHWPHPLSVSPLTGVIAAQSEPYPAETVLRVSEALDELETVTPSYHLTDLAHSPRTFFPRGSALFHQGRLVVSHLPAGELVEVVIFCQSYRLLEISAHEPRSSIVVWREVHLRQSSSSEVEDVEMRGRVFLLLVGLDGVLVGLVMEGCGLTDEATPTLDPAYVTEAKQLIAKLDLQDIFDSNTSGRGSVKPQIPPVASLDRVLTAHLSSPRHSSHPPHTPRSSRRRSLDQHNHTRQGSDSEDDEGSGLTPRSMTLPSLRPRGKKRSNDLPSLPETLPLRQNYTLTAGNDNILLHYLSLEAGLGAWLGPTHHTSSTYGTLHSEMVTCFHTTCSSIREILLAKTDEDLEDDEDWEESEEEEETAIERQATLSPPTFSCPPLTGGPCVEHGVLLEVSLRNFATEKQLRNIPPLCYWVIGRLFPETGRELYVCYEENVSQTMVEMTFRLLFASPTT